MHLASIQCGYFDSIRRKGRNVSVQSILDEIRGGKWGAQIEKLRQLSEADYPKEKACLPAFMLSASTKNGGHKEQDIETHSGLLQLDIDHLTDAEAAIACREALRSDDHILAAWLSPSGSGVKAVLCIPDQVQTHRASFSAAQAWIREKHGYEIDAHCADPCRLCFISHDADLWLNPSAVELPVDATASLLVATGSVTNNSAPFLPSSFSTLPSAFYILHNKGTQDVFGDFPSLQTLYQTLVTKRFPSMQSGVRNEALCEMVPLLYSAISPQFILPFAEKFYEQYRGVFKDSLNDHMKEAASLLDGCQRNYANSQLSPDERSRYTLAENELQRTTFRICHSLAACEGEDCPPPIFFLSCEKLAHRIGCLEMQAGRLLKWLQSIEVVERIEVGQRRAKGQQARASRFKWLLPSSKVKSSGAALPHALANANL